jgi:hypothetical protein
MADKDIMKALGGGASKTIPWWLKLGIFLVIELVLWGATLDFGLWLILSVFLLGIGWVCFLDKGNILLTLAVLVFATLLVGTSFGDPMRNIANGVKGIGDTGGKSVQNVQLPSGPVTTAPAPVPAAAPAPAAQQ